MAGGQTTRCRRLPRRLPSQSFPATLRPPQTTPPAEAAAKAAAAAAAEEEEDSEDAVFYENCTAVREAGADPIRRGDPGYSTDLDRDQDGIACE